MNWTLSVTELIAINAAAHGLVSGTLEEWPELASAFRKIGVNADPEMNLIQMILYARFWLAHRN